jgi:hypothetical protein
MTMAAGLAFMVGVIVGIAVAIAGLVISEVVDFVRSQE